MSSARARAAAARARRRSAVRWPRRRPCGACGCPSGSRPVAASWARSIASAPSPASPTTSRSSWVSRNSRKPVRTSSWSSTISSRMLTRHHRPAAAPRPGSRRPRGARSRALLRAGRPARACRRCPCPVGVALGRVSARRAVVDDLELEARAAERQRHRDTGGVRVLEHVGERLLDDAVDRQLDAAGQRLRLADHLQAHRQSGVAVARDQLVQLARATAAGATRRRARARAAARGSAAARPGSARRWSRRGRACRRPRRARCAARRARRARRPASR